MVKASATEWHLWYGGNTGGGGNKGVGHATSSNGVDWTKNAANPLQSLGGHGPFGGLGAPGTWNDNRNYAMSVIYDPDRFSGYGDASLLKMWRTGRMGSSGDDFTIGHTSADTVTTFRSIAGSDRFATSVAASKEAFPGGADEVIIATGENWPDALGGTALAGALDCPILLVQTDSIPGIVRAEIARLGATQAIILGGESAVSKAVGNSLAGMGLGVTRLGGSDRYATARMVAHATVDELGPAFDGTAFVATGMTFPDALAASPLAANRGWPIYLASASSGAPTGAMKAEGVTDVLVLGGPAAVSDAHYFGVVGGVGSGHVERLAASDRYGTAAVVASYGVDEAGLRWDWLAIATGELFPDALSGGLVPAGKDSVMLLTQTRVLPPSTAGRLSANRETIANVYYLGGPVAVSEGVRDSVEKLLR